MDPRHVRVAFVDFWPGFEPEGHMLTRALAVDREVALVDQADADIVFFSVFGPGPPSFVGTRVYVTVENLKPLWSSADFFIGFDLAPNPRLLRMPTFVFHAFEDKVDGFELPPSPPWEEREFCNSIYWNEGPEARRVLFERLNAYRPVASPGRFLNNVTAPELAPRGDDHWRRSKLLYQQRFRFTIACENSSFPGYTTEKLYDALVAGTIPIYWGNPRVDVDFDKRAFVDTRSFRNFDDLVDHVRRIDTDSQLAATYLSHRNALRTPLDEYFERLVEFLDRVIAHAQRERRRRGSPRLRAVRLRADRLARAKLRSLKNAGERDKRGFLPGQDRG